MPGRDATPILVVENDHGLRKLIRDELEEAGQRVIEAVDAPRARMAMRRHAPALIISDLHLPCEDGLALLEYSRAQPLPPAFVMITASGTVEQAVDALKRGVDDFLTRPLKLEHLRLTVARALERRDLQRQVAAYRELLEGGDFHGLIGRSAPMRLLFEQIRRIARAQGPVLILGESGVGKELVARALHRESDRREGPFVALNCAGIPSELLESELFGHAAGAFTGAREARRGLFSEAEGGTLLLDELGEMPAGMQSKLLRVLQDGSLRPVGADREREIDVRIVAATNRDLEADVEAGRFRADLFYRLDTFFLEVPPLRQRGDDIDLLAAHFLSRHAGSAGSAVRGMSSEALDCLRAYPFPGNVRELSNALERALVFCRGDQLALADLPARVRQVREQPAGSAEEPGAWRPEPLRTVEMRHVRRVLRYTDNNKQRAARLLGIGRRTLYRYLGRDG